MTYAARRLPTFLVAACLALCAPLAAALMPAPQPPLVAAGAWLLIDGRSGAVLTAQDGEKPLPIASLTKMMTTYVADHALQEGRIGMGDQVRVSEKAWRTGMEEGSRMYIDVNSLVSVEDLMRGIIIQSGNDASVAIAEHIAGSEEQFVGLMNQYAQKLGMKNTLYKDATGLDDTQYSSAHDLAILARAIIYEFPDNYRMYAEKEFNFNGIKQANRNKLLWRDPAVDGLKTGHTNAAGYCLVASAQRGDTRMIAVVLNTASENARADETAKLLDWGFRSFETWAPYPAGTVLQQAPVWMGEQDAVALGVLQDMVLTIPRGARAGLKATITVQPELRAPLKKGDVVGKLVVKHGEQLIAEQPLVAMADVPEGGIFKRCWHWLQLFFSGLFG